MERKELVKKLGEFLGVKPNYLGVPSFAYEIEVEEETYTIDRQGIITNSVGVIKTFDEIVNKLEHRKETKDISKKQTANFKAEMTEVILSLNGHTGNTLKNLVNMLYSKQYLIMLAFETNVPFIDETFSQELNNRKVDTFEEFEKLLEEQEIGRLPGVIFNFSKETFTIKLFAKRIDPEKGFAFKDLVTCINENAKKQKRASFKKVVSDNPKYTFRTWLNRLGMSGKGYKSTRRILLKNLEGDAAFRKMRLKNG